VVRTDPRPSTIRAVIDTSSLFAARHRRALEQAARTGRIVAIWSPWIIAELNRVLVWRWIELSGDDLSSENQRRCSDSADAMMRVMLPTFELVAPLPPYPPAWEGLRDASDEPIWAAAKLGNADYVVSENRRDYPPPGPDGRHTHDGIEYLPADAFLALLRQAPSEPGQ
jgi:predicted nucleic acid-binding protein